MLLANLKARNFFLYSIVSVFLLFLAYSEALKNITVYLLIGFLLFQIVFQKIELTRDIINLSIISHLIIVIVGIWFGINSDESINQYMDVVHIVLIFLFFREAKLNFLTYESIINFLFVGFIFAVFIGLFNYLYLGQPRLELHSVGSVNRSSVYMMYIFITAICLMSQYKNKLSRLLFPFVAFLSLLSLILAASRMAIYSLPFIITLYLLLSRKIKLKNFYLSLFLLVFSLFALYLLLPESSVLKTKLSMGIVDIPRFQIWIVSINAWLQNNLFFGIGVGNSIFIDVKDYFYDAARTQFIDNTHNVFLDMLLERGILGLISFIIFLSAIFFHRDVNHPNFTILLKVLIFSLLLMGISNITFRYEFALLFVTIIGSYLNPSIHK